MDYELLKYFEGYKIRKVKKQITATAAFNEQQQITEEAVIILPEPFNTNVKVYLMHELGQILIGEPTLRKWKYSLIEDGSRINEQKQKFKNQLINHNPKLFSTEERKPKERNFKYHILTTDEIPIMLVPYFTTAFLYLLEHAI